MDRELFIDSAGNRFYVTDNGWVPADDLTDHRMKRVARRLKLLADVADARERQRDQLVARWLKRQEEED